MLDARASAAMYSLIQAAPVTRPRAYQPSCVTDVRIPVVACREIASMYLRLRQPDIAFEEIVVTPLVCLLHVSGVQAHVAALEMPRLWPV